MTELLDANVVCRYLSGDHPDHSERAATLIESERPLRISVLILAEAAHVLRSVYGHPSAPVADALIALLQRENIEAHEVETDLVVAVLLGCRGSGRVSVPDALLWALARAAAPTRVWTFDRRFPREGLEVCEPSR